MADGDAASIHGVKPATPDAWPHRTRRKQGVQPAFNQAPVWIHSDCRDAHRLNELARSRPLGRGLRKDGRRLRPVRGLSPNPVCGSRFDLCSCLGTCAQHTQSQELFSAAQKPMPGGVSSPVRAFRSVGGQPIVFDRVKGAYAWDVDGNRHIDYIGSWGPAIGHAHPGGDRRAARRPGEGHQLWRPLCPGEPAGGDGDRRGPPLRWCASSTAAPRPACRCCA